VVRLEDEPERHTMSVFIVIIPFSLILFFLRDYLLLQMGPGRLPSVRLPLYCVVLLVSVFAVSGALSRLSNEQILHLFRAPMVALPVAGYYAVLISLCLWFRGTYRHYRAWLLAAAPNPLLATGIALLGRLIFSSSPLYAEIIGSGLIACVWIVLIGVSLRGTVEIRMDASDLDYSMRIAICVNAIALFLCKPIF
jgi:hypothetical protein